MNKINHNPDILDAIANLSSDEVFTPPKIVNDILDTLPSELWKDKDATFLDPTAKSGVFLREIAKRLIKGIEEEIPDLQERLNHIYNNQLFGISITKLTSLLARRSLYCSKEANGEYSVCTNFKDEKGNIRFERIEHTWINGKCKFCSANKSEYDRDEILETHAYEFIHNSSKDINNLFNKKNMKFDVIIGNPPYQLNDGGGPGSSAVPIYQKFIEKGKSLNPRYFSMIIPSRWFSSGKGLDRFRKSMLSDKRLKTIIDYPNANDCFPEIKLEGGVCYFLWDKEYNGDCEVTTIMNGKKISSGKRDLKEYDILIRFEESIAILNKIKEKNEKTLDKKVSYRNPFGIYANFKNYKKNKFNNFVKLYLRGDIGYVIKNEIKNNQKWINKYKILISKAYGLGNSFPQQIIGKPILAKKNSCCTETYLVLSIFDKKKEAENFGKYVKTRFFRFLVLLKKNTQNTTKNKFSFVPDLDMSKKWTDEKLYKRYNLNKKETDFIESMIRSME